MPIEIIIPLISITALIGYCLYAVSGNKKTKRADASISDAVKEMKAPPEQSVIYIVRRGFVASLQGMDVTVSGAGSGHIRSGMFLRAVLPPGHYEVKGALARTGKMPVSLSVTTRANEVIVIQVVIKMGLWAAKPTISLVQDRYAAKSLIKSSALALFKTGPAAGSLS